MNDKRETFVIVYVVLGFVLGAVGTGSVYLARSLGAPTKQATVSTIQVKNVLDSLGLTPIQKAKETIAQNAQSNGITVLSQTVVSSKTNGKKATIVMQVNFVNNGKPGTVKIQVVLDRSVWSVTSTKQV